MEECGDVRRAIAREKQIKGWRRKRTLFKYKLHQDSELFDKANGYIREYY